MISAYAPVELQDPHVLGNRCWHICMDILCFPFNVILSYNCTHFIEKRFDALMANLLPWQKKCQGV
jgi:hypothetical protein